MQKTHKITRYLHKTTFKNLLVLHYCLTKNFILMKKMVLIVALGLMSTTMFAKRWYYNCPGGGRVYFTTSDDTTSGQAAAMGQAWCDNRP